MKKIVPFTKDIKFNTKIYEITSISLEHTLHHEEEYLITGDFIISGEYRVTDASVNTESFDFKIPSASGLLQILPRHTTRIFMRFYILGFSKLK